MCSNKGISCTKNREKKFFKKTHEKLSNYKKVINYRQKLHKKFKIKKKKLTLIGWIKKIEICYKGTKKIEIVLA